MNIKHQNKRIAFIELLRFIFALTVISYHCFFHIVKKENTQLIFAQNGYFAVEFFLIVSGLLMAKAVSKPKNDKISLGSETAKFLGKKYFSVFPYHLFSFFAGFTVIVILNNLSVKEIAYRFISALPQFFLIEMSGIEMVFVDKNLWYLSAMFIAMAIIYPLLRKRFDLTSKVIAPLAGIMLWGWISQNQKTLSYPTLWMGNFYKGLIRAIAVICISVAAYNVYKKICETNFTKFGELTLFAVEIFGYAASFAFIFSEKSEKYAFYLVFFLALSVAITFSQKTLSSKLKGSFFTFLGRLSLPLYLNQFYPELFFNTYFNNLSVEKKSILSAITSLICATICLFVVDALKKINYKKLFIKEENN